MRRILLILFCIFSFGMSTSVLAASGDTLIVFTPLHNEQTAHRKELYS